MSKLKISLDFGPTQNTDNLRLECAFPGIKLSVLTHIGVKFWLCVHWTPCSIPGVKLSVLTYIEVKFSLCALDSVFIYE
jgi:hypothetical protein